MTEALLTRAPHRPPPTLALTGEVSLPLGRVHEICGRARRTLALMIAARAGAPMFWIAPAWGTDPLNPDGMQALLPPQDVTFVTPKRIEDMLWCMEEALRSGTVPVVDSSGYFEMLYGNTRSPGRGGWPSKRERRCRGREGRRV